MNKFYKVSMVTDNPSEDRYGYFSTKEKAEEVIKEWTEKTSKDPDFYGTVKFYTDELTIDDNIN